MKVAVIHNYLDNIGGAERVGLTLARDLKADIYTTSYSQDAIEKQGFNIKPRSIGTVPLNAPFRQQLTNWKFKKLNLRNKYDYFIIDGDWAISAGVNNKPNMWYCHSPIREIWDLHSYTKQKLLRFNFWQVPLFNIWSSYNRFMNKKQVKHINKIVSNSINVQNRVKKYFKRDSVVINPPVETSKFRYEQNGDFWLSVNRLVSHKRIEMQMDAFRNLPNEKLIIVGSFEQSTHMKNYVYFLNKIKPSNVEILSGVDFSDLVKLYANCKGFITTSLDEDFGITPVEAMASGKPVIATNEGGYKETVVDEVTGRLIDDINPDKLAKAIKEVGKNPKSYKSACLKQAKKFDVTIFVKKINEQLDND
jgi:glycosyltransferase involved in cell wall biosynthesis